MRTGLAIFIALSLPASLAAEPDSFADSLAGKLVKVDPATGKGRAHELENATEIKYFMIYFSAYWCPPCRKMTPALAEFYKETKATHPEFEIILISADRDEAGMERYLKWAEMPWPAVAWEHREEIATLADLSPPAIPFMAMLDGQGRLLGASDLGGFNVGIPKILNGLQAELGIEVYDVQERHGKTSPFIFIAYAAAAVFVLSVIARRKLASKA